MSLPSKTVVFEILREIFKIFLQFLSGRVDPWLLYPDSATGADNEGTAMKIKTLFAKGLVISAIASTMALGAGVAGASASDGRHERNTSGSEHEQGSEHGHDDDRDDDDGEENGRGHETHGQGWGFGHGTGEDANEDSTDEDANEDSSDDSGDESSDDESGDDDSGPVVSVPVVDVPVVDEPAVVVPVDSTPDTTVTSIETPAVARENPASAATTESSPTNDSSLANPQVTTETGSAIDVQPQVVIAAPEFAREVADAPATTTSDAALEIAGSETANATSGSLPMTGASSLVALGLAASLLAAGWLIIAGRRRNEVA